MMRLRRYAVLCAMAAFIPPWSDTAPAKDAEKETCNKTVLELGEGVERIEWLFPGASVMKFLGFVLYRNGRVLRVEGNSHGFCDPDPNHKVHSNHWLTPEERGVTSRLLEFRPEMNVDDSSGTAERGPMDDTPTVGFLFARSAVNTLAALGRDYHLSSLAVLMNKAQRYRIINLPPERLFMSRHLNPFALGRDAKNRAFSLGVALIEGHISRGPALSVYGYYDGRLGLIARSPWHGDKNGWMVLAKAFDLDWDGCPELAVVRDPQADGTLEIWQLRHEPSPDGTPFTLVKRAEAKGFSNHVFGTFSNRIAVTTDLDGDGTFDLVVPDQTRKVLRVMSLKGGRLEEIHRVELPAPVAHDLTYHVAWKDPRRVTLAVPLEDDTIRLVPLEHPQKRLQRRRPRCNAAYQPN